MVHEPTSPQVPNGEGLQYLFHNEWRPVATSPGDVVVQAGDVLAFLADYRSNYHRVDIPSDPEQVYSSIIYFESLKDETWVACVEIRVSV